MPVSWILVSLSAAVVSAMVVWAIMRARCAAALAEARGELKSAAESARRHALDEFLADMRVEERHYVREQKLLFLHRRSLVMQERVFFRNIPLSNWIEHERLLEEGADVEQMARSLSVFDPKLLLS
ncbi:MAG: hypothetical protein FJW37_02665 [Acidobacteria bacterium]|nr:hypothetical protein [Acidobacteriota bacterium]